MSADPLALTFPLEAVEAIAARAAELVLEQLRESAQVANGVTPKYLSPADAATYIGKSRQRIYDLVTVGRLTRLKDGTSVLVSVEELDAYLAGKPTGRRA